MGSARRRRGRNGRAGAVGLVVGAAVAVAIVAGAVAVAVGVAAGGAVSESGPSGAAATADPTRPGGEPAPGPGDGSDAGGSATGRDAHGGVPAAGTGGGSSGGGITGLVDPGWVQRVAASTGIPSRALAAYAGAERALAAEQPGCRVSWNTLAAIGFVESEHGTLQGGTIGDDGVAAPPIVGIALDGQGVDALRDTDGGALDGDTVWDRAVGPMQFIPDTWAEWGADGDGDGLVDAHQIDDAALAAARYLCAAGGDLADPAHWIAAIASYNTALDYNHRVAATADTYAALTPAT